MVTKCEAYSEVLGRCCNARAKHTVYGTRCVCTKHKQMMKHTTLKFLPHGVRSEKALIGGCYG